MFNDPYPNDVPITPMHSEDIMSESSLYPDYVQDPNALLDGDSFGEAGRGSIFIRNEFTGNQAPFLSQGGNWVFQGLRHVKQVRPGEYQLDYEAVYQLG
jgi:hypothetical protein